MSDRSEIGAPAAVLVRDACTTVWSGLRGIAGTGGDRKNCREKTSEVEHVGVS